MKSQSDRSRRRNAWHSSSQAAVSREMFVALRPAAASPSSTGSASRKSPFDKPRRCSAAPQRAARPFPRSPCSGAPSIHPRPPVLPPPTSGSSTSAFVGQALGGVRARSLSALDPDLAQVLGALSGIRFCSSARRRCSSRRHCSPVPCPPGGRYGLTRRRPCGQSDSTPAVTVRAHNERIPHRTPTDVSRPDAGHRWIVARGPGVSVRPWREAVVAPRDRAPRPHSPEATGGDVPLAVGFRG